MTLSSKRKKNHSPVVTWELFSLSMYHSCEWQTLIFLFEQSESMWKLFFFPPLTMVVIFFHYSPLILLNVFGYFVYTVCTCGDWCVCGAESFVFDTRVHVLYIYLFFPTCSSLKIKRNGNLKLSVICSEWAAECKHWYGPLIFSHPHGRQMTERKWGRQNNITIIIIVIL